MRTPSNRRSFLSTLASITGIAALEGWSPTTARAALPPSAEWDLTWLDALNGKHKQIFAPGDLTNHRPLHVVVNYLDAHREVFGLQFPDVNAIVGVATSFPINANDALWDRYELGRLWQLKDPGTSDWARRNIYLDNMPAPEGKIVGVKPLQARGVVFYQCNNALNGAVSRIAGEFNLATNTVRADVVANLNPGVRIVPAHTMVLGLAQERGFTYEQIG